jgi:hypothetical protein
MVRKKNLKKYRVSSTVWVYPGMAAWRFVHVDKKQSDDIKERFGKNRRGFGSLPVFVTLGKTSWKTSIFPDKQSGTYLLPLKAKVRLAEGVLDEDKVDFTIEIRA